MLPLLSSLTHFKSTAMLLRQTCMGVKNTEILAAATLCQIPVYVAYDTPQMDAGKCTDH